MHHAPPPLELADFISQRNGRSKSCVPSSIIRKPTPKEGARGSALLASTTRKAKNIHAKRHRPR
eukprot:2235834-Prymnesium_polylepis.1